MIMFTIVFLMIILICFLYSAIVQTSIINTSTWSRNIAKRQPWFEGRLRIRAFINNIVTQINT